VLGLVGIVTGQTGGGLDPRGSGYHLGPTENVVTMQMNPHHVRFATTINLASLDDLFSAIDALDPKFRDKHLMFGFKMVVGVKMQRTPPPDPNTLMKDLIENTINYRIFKEKCQTLAANGLHELFIVPGFILSVCGKLYHHGNLDMIDEAVHRMELLADMSESDAYKTEDLDKRAQLLEMAAKFREESKGIPDVMRQGHEAYEHFCNTTVKMMNDVTNKKVGRR
jgi:hypothetical protein